MQIRIDAAGRIVLPKPVREKLQLAPGDALELDQVDDRITLSPARQRTGMRRKQGVWVFAAGEKLTTEKVRDALDESRRERDRHAGL